MKYKYILDEDAFFMEVATTQDVNDLLQMLNRLKEKVYKVYYKGSIFYIDYIIDFIESQMDHGETYKKIVYGILSYRLYE